MQAMWLLVLSLLIGGAPTAWAQEEHAHEGHAHEGRPAGAVGEQTLTGEVVDTFCYLSHDKEGLGKGHASCAKKCIEGGLPVAIKVGDQLYLATMANHEPANKTLAALAGQQVTVHGKVLEQDGQHLIAITHVEKLD
jgi:hypothetical protein